jgi:menaquinone-dependent protoporphyrinogen oxidase
MSNARILIVYGSTYGQTAKIAGRIGEMLEVRGMDVSIARGDELPPSGTLDGYDGVVVGASLIMGKHQEYIDRFVRAHADELASVPSAFLSVSGSAGSRRPADRAAARRIADEFLAAAGWRPQIVETVAGAVAYTRYGTLTRWMMRLISRREGGSTDTTRDHEYTDWAQVERIVEEFAALIPQPAVPMPLAPV